MPLVEKCLYQFILFRAWGCTRLHPCNAFQIHKRSALFLFQRRSFHPHHNSGESRQSYCNYIGGAGLIQQDCLCKGSAEQSSCFMDLILKPKHVFANYLTVSLPSSHETNNCHDRVAFSAPICRPVNLVQTLRKPPLTAQLVCMTYCSLLLETD